MKSKLAKRRFLALLLTFALVFGQGSIASAAEIGNDGAGNDVEVVDIQEENEQEEQEESPSVSATPEETSSEEPEETASPEATAVPVESPEQSPSAEVTPEPIESPEVTETPDVTASPEETETPDASETPSETPDASVTPSELPTETPEAELLFSGLPEEYSLSSDDLEDKRDLQQHTGDLDSCLEGQDYVENEIVVGAETEELAEVYAKAFNGTLREWSGGVAVITLNADKTRALVTVADAVNASADMNMKLPAAWPNYYYYLDTEAENVFDVETPNYIGENEEEATGEAVDSEEEADPEEGASMELDVSYSDPYLQPSSASYQWYHTVIGSKEAWNAGYTGSGVTVAVVDSGLYGGHSDVSGTQINCGLGTGDGNGHGTHVAGIIAAKGNNNLGGVGVAPGVSLKSVRVFDSSGSAPTSDIMKGFDAAVNSGANIINMSLGGVGYTKLFQDKITNAYNRGIAVFCAAGNDASNSAHYPASYKNAIAVAAVDKDNYLASFSNYGSHVRYSAPGVGIYSTFNGGSSSFYVMNGTSQATPVTSGIAAVLLSSGKVTGTGKAKVDNLLKLMDSACVKAQGSGSGKGVVYLPKALGLSTVMTKPKNPTFNMKAGTYANTGIAVTIKAENGMSIYYSLDGKSITYKNGQLSSNAKAYTGPVSVGGSASVTLKAIAVNPNNGLASGVVSAKYTFKPVASAVTIKSPTGINTVAKGSSLKLEAIVTPTYAKDKSVQWSIDGKPEGLTVSGGTVKASAKAKTGTYTVRAVAKNANGKYAGAAKTYNINVVDVANPVTVIKANPTKVSVANGKSASVTITVTKKDKSAGTAANDIVWTSANAGIATAAASGNTLTVTGKSAGKTSITGVAKDGSGKKITIPVTVTQLVTGITISGPSTLAAGKSVQLTATVSPSNATNKKVTWTMATNTKDVTVSSSGKVTAKSGAATGYYKVRATAADGSGKYGEYTVYVSAGKMTSLKLQKTSVNLFRVKNQYNSPTSATVYVTAAGANTGNWTVESSNPGIVAVSKGNGYITVAATGKATGTSTVTVKSTDGTNLKSSCKVTVSNPLSKVLLSPEKNRSECLAMGKTVKLTPSFETAYGTVSSGAKKLTWSSSNPKIATVDQSGKVKALASGYQTVTITARTTDGSNVAASYTITLCDTISYLKVGSNLWGLYKAPEGSTGSLAIYMGTANGYPSYELASKVNKAGLSTGFAYSNGTYYLTIGANKKGTYKVTVSCLDGSSAKNTITIKVY